MITITIKLDYDEEKDEMDLGYDVASNSPNDTEEKTSILIESLMGSLMHSIDTVHDHGDN